MNCRLRLVVALVSLAPVACTAEPPSYAAYTAALDLLSAGTDTDAPTTSTTGSEASTTSTTAAATTTTGTLGTATTTIGTESDGGTGTTGDDGKAVPVEVEVFLIPSSVNAVGEVRVDVSTSRPVVAIDIFDGDKPLVLGAAPKDPVTVFEVTSDNAPGDGLHTIRAVAHTADGVSGQAEKDLSIDVAPGGTDVWTPYVQAGPINGFTGAALLGQSIAASGFLETQEGLVAVVVKLDGATGKLEAGPITLGKISLAAAGSGPAIAAGDDGAVYVASTRAGSLTWAVSKVRPGEPLPLVWTVTGDAKTKAYGITFAGDRVIVVGATEISPGTHDLKVWWLAAEDGAVLHEATFAMPKDDDWGNARDELGRGTAIVGEEVVVVGEREIKDAFNKIYRRAVVLRYSLEGAMLGEWTSPGELLEEDGGMAVAPLRSGGFVFTGWGRNKGTIRQVLTRWFTAAGDTGPVRIESTPGSDAIGYALGEDREGKIIVAGSRKEAPTDADAWIFAIPGPLGAHVWDVVRMGPGKGPDDAAGLAVGPWGHVSIAGSEFADLQPRAFALHLYP